MLRPGPPYVYKVTTSKKQPRPQCCKKEAVSYLASASGVKESSGPFVSDSGDGQPFFHHSCSHSMLRIDYHRSTTKLPQRVQTGAGNSKALLFPPLSNPRLPSSYFTHGIGTQEPKLSSRVTAWLAGYGSRTKAACSPHLPGLGAGVTLISFQLALLCSNNSKDGTLYH